MFLALIICSLFVTNNHIKMEYWMEQIKLYWIMPSAKRSFATAKVEEAIASLHLENIQANRLNLPLALIGTQELPIKWRG